MVDNITRLMGLSDNCDHGNSNSGNDLYQEPTHCFVCNTYKEAVNEILILRKTVDRWKSLCERAMDYQLGSSDWQDIRIAYDTALKDYNAQRSS